jgi:hypothetical protein
MYRIFFGENDHLVDLGRDWMMRVGLNRCLFDASGSRYRRLADCVKRNNFSMDLANIVFLKRTLPLAVISYWDLSLNNLKTYMLIRNYFFGKSVYWCGFILTECVAFGDARICSHSVSKFPFMLFWRSWFHKLNQLQWSQFSLGSVRQKGNRDSSVGVVTRYGLGGLGSNPGGAEIFSTCPDRPWSPPNLLHHGCGSFPGLKQPGCGVDHPPPSSAEVKERANIT